MILLKENQDDIFLFFCIYNKEVISIKNIIEYFYKISVLELHYKANMYFFRYGTDWYLFIPAQRTEAELLEIHQLIKNNQLYDQIIQNIDNHYLTQTKRGYYILVRKSANATNFNLESSIIQSRLSLIFVNNYQNINRTNWVEMWSKKIDYIEYQLLHIESKYPIISKSINYYIGMTEASISYLNNNFSWTDELNIRGVISHKRVVSNNFNNAMNIVVDHFARDVSEYLKYIFINNEYNYSDIDAFLRRCDLTEDDVKLIYARLMYPSYYFDLYDKIVNGNEEEKKILTLISRSVEYEIFVKNIYTMLFKVDSSIFSIGWIN